MAWLKTLDFFPTQSLKKFNVLKLKHQTKSNPVLKYGEKKLKEKTFFFTQ